MSRDYNRFYSKNNGNGERVELKAINRFTITIPTRREERIRKILTCRDTFYKARNVAEILSRFNDRNFTEQSVFDIDLSVDQLKMSTLVKRNITELKTLL